MRETDNHHLPRYKNGEPVIHREELDTSESPILYNLTQLNGERYVAGVELMGDYIVKGVLDNSRIRIVTIIGEPGAGKSTIRGQLKHELLKRTKSPLVVNTYSWDQHLNDLMDTELGDWHNWKGPQERKRASLLFTEKIIAKLKAMKEAKRVDPKGPREILLLEMPAVGEMDYGASTLYNLARRKDSFVVAIAGTDINSQRRRVEIRTFIQNTPVEKVQEELLRVYGIRVHGLESLSKEAAGEIIKKQSLAGQNTIQRIENEILRIADRWLRRKKTKIVDPLSYVPLPVTSEILSEDELEKYKKKSFYTRTLIRNLPIGSDRRVAVVNPVQEQVDMYLDAAA